MLSQVKLTTLFLLLAALLLCSFPAPLMLCQAYGQQSIDDDESYASYDPYAYQGSAYSTVEHHHHHPSQQPPSQSASASFSSGCDYEEKVLKARAIVDVLSRGGGSADGVVDSHGMAFIGKQWLIDERFKWMRPFEFYECGQGQEF